VKTRQYGSRALVLGFIVAVTLVVAAGCTTKIRGWSQQSYRSPDFSLQHLKDGGLALLPAIILHQPGPATSGSNATNPPAPYTPQQSQQENGNVTATKDGDGYRVVLDETLLSRLQTRLPYLRLVPTGDALKMINDAGLTDTYTRFYRDFNTTGMDSGFLKELGKTLHCRYLMVSRGVITESKSDASVSFVWTFGRKSIMRSIKISSQIWDTNTGQQVWEGSGVGYNRLSAYEKAPIAEQMANAAVVNLLQSMIP
jgi:hypothetical protein